MGERGGRVAVLLSDEDRFAADRPGAAPGGPMGCGPGGWPGMTTWRTSRSSVSLWPGRPTGYARDAPSRRRSWAISRGRWPASPWQDQKSRGRLPAVPSLRLLGAAF